MSTLELWYPCKPKGVVQGFGNVMPIYTAMGLRGHNGIDFQAFHGQPVYASHDGTCYPEIDGKGGNGVVIRSDKPYDWQGQQVYFKSIYWHLVDANAVVKTGQAVKVGDLIGYADNTGQSTGDHLHFGLKVQQYNEVDFTWYNLGMGDGYLGAIDPAPFFNGYFAEDSGKVLTILGQIISALTALISSKKPK